MTAENQFTPDESFDDAEDFVGGVDMSVRYKPGYLYVCTGDNSARLDVSEARQMRAWLDKVLP